MQRKVLGYAVHWNADFEAGEIVIALDGDDEPKRLAFTKEHDQEANFLATLAALQSGPVTADDHSGLIRSADWVVCPGSEGPKIDLPWADEKQGAS